MKENLLRLLIVEDSSNDAEAIINVMRRAGYAVRPVRVHNRDSMQAALKDQPLDVILCASNLAEFTVQQALALVKKSGKDISFIVLADTPSGPLTVELLNAGARDIIPKDQVELLQLVIVREFKDLEERRDHRRCLKALRETEKRCRSLIDSSRDAIAYVHDGMHIYANTVYLRMFGYETAEELESTPVMDLVAPVDHARFKDFLRTYAVDEETTKELEVNGLHTNNSTFNAMMKFSPASIDGEACTQIIIQDLSGNEELEDKIKTLSQRDLLTGLYNRQYFLTELESAVAKAAAGSGNSVLLYIQLDNFYSIQETAGVAASDLVLRDIAALLSAQTEESNILAYFGNDVFTLLIRDRDMDHAQQVAEKIRKAMEGSTYDAAGQPANTTCSIIIGLIAEYLLSSKVFLKEISKLCGREKANGGNKIHLYSPDEEAQSAKGKLHEKATQIQAALDNNRFRLLYQPIVSLHGLPGENYQILVCMLDEKSDPIEPGKFMDTAEHVGLATAIDRWIIARAIEVLATQRRPGTKLNFFIKLCEYTIKDESLLPWLSEFIKATRLEADSLVFELSEATALSQLPETQIFIKGLKELRCRFSLDHFGSNLNSIAQLKRLPAGIDYLKVDASFQDKLSTNTENQNAVKSINEAARSLGIATIAEGVEDAGTLAVLWQLGVNYVQGYYLQKPGEALDYDFSGSA
ncbi:MAG: EAL domain-containing protein [Gammaproteobacteria bacterium]